MCCVEICLVHYNAVCVFGSWLRWETHEHCAAVQEDIGVDPLGTFVRSPDAYAGQVVR